jgi:hypothetical protein
MSEETESRNVAVAEGNRCCSRDWQHSRRDIGAMKLRRIQDLPSSPREHLETDW